jgi:hypothetical protein
MPRVAPISWLDCPATSARNTSSSRFVSPPGSSRGRRCTRVPGGGEHRIDRLGTQPALARFVQQLRFGAGLVERGPVGPLLAHRLVAVGGGEDAARAVEPRCERLAVVAGAIEPLVVSAGQRADLRERLRVRERALGVVRVQAHALPVAQSERPRLLPDRVRHADAAEIERERRTPHLCDLAGREVQAPCRSLGQLRHGLGVSAQPARLEIGERRGDAERGIDLVAGDPALWRRLAGDRLVPDLRFVQAEQEVVEVLDRESGEPPRGS